MRCASVPFCGDLPTDLRRVLNYPENYSRQILEEFSGRLLMDDTCNAVAESNFKNSVANFVRYGEKLAIANG